MASTFKNSVENRFNKILLYNFIGAIVTLVLGMILLFLPELTNKVVGVLTGVIFLISGALAIYNYLQRDGAKLFSLNLIFGILDFLLGAIIIVFPFSVSTFVTICFGLYMIINGVKKINYSFWLKKGSEECWLITLVTGILLIIFGIMVMFNPFVKFTITKLVGAFLLVIAALEITNTILFKKRAKEIRDIFW